MGRPLDTYYHVIRVSEGWAVVAIATGWIVETDSEKQAAESRALELSAEASKHDGDVVW